MERSVGILVDQEENLSFLASLITVPSIAHTISTSLFGQSIHISFIEYPTSPSANAVKRKKKLLQKLSTQQGFEFILEVDRSCQYNVLWNREEVVDFSELKAEIEAMKALWALIGKSREDKKNYLSQNIGFLTEDIPHKMVDMLSEEAVGVLLYCSSETAVQTLESLSSELLNRKGISAVVSRDMDVIVRNSEVVVIDDKLDLSSCSHNLKQKLALGENKALNYGNAIKEAIAWNEGIKNNPLRELYERYNRELLAILRHHHPDIDYREFVKCFKYIYLHK